MWNAKFCMILWKRCQIIHNLEKPSKTQYMYLDHLRPDGRQWSCRWVRLTSRSLPGFGWPPSHCHMWKHPNLKSISCSQTLRNLWTKLFLKKQFQVAVALKNPKTPTTVQIQSEGSVTKSEFFLVYKEQLNELLQFCLKCGSLIISENTIEVQNEGSHRSRESSHHSWDFLLQNSLLQIWSTVKN